MRYIMDVERRLENRRMKIARRMEVACLDTGRHFIGETEDVSDSGIRACLDRSPDAGTSVMVRLYWDESNQPVETFGRVAWTSTLPAGDGIEVGLMLGAESDVYGNAPKKRSATRYLRYSPGKTDHNATRAHAYFPLENDWGAYDDDSIENKKTLAAAVVSAPLRSGVTVEAASIALATGESFKVTLQGKETWAKITATEEVDTEGKMTLCIQLKDKKLWRRKPQVMAPVVASSRPIREDRSILFQHQNDTAAESESAESDEWQPDPFGDSFPMVKKVAVFLWRFGRKFTFGAARFTRKASFAAWQRLPLSARAKIVESKDTVFRYALVPRLKHSAQSMKERARGAHLHGNQRRRQQ